MLKIAALYFCLTICLVSGDGNATSEVVSRVSKPNPVAATVLNSTDFEVPAEPTAEPTAATNTTVAPITTTVTPSPKPGPAPNTTTTSTTTTTTTSTTTSTTTTTTKAPPTTTSGPPVTTPAPAPKTGTWVVNGTNETCIVVQMAVQFNVSYETTDNKTLWQELTLPTLNHSATTSGSCGAKEQTLDITWVPGGDLVFHFTKNDTNEKYSLHHIEVAFDKNNFPNIKPNTTVKFVHEADHFPTKLNNSYRCMRLQKLGLMRNASNETTGYLEISNLQFEAFKSDKATGFGTAEDCSTDVPDVVPIAVGCALTVLVIIVLAAYLIGRRRSQARGYVSM